MPTRTGHGEQDDISGVISVTPADTLDWMMQNVPVDDRTNWCKYGHYEEGDRPFHPCVNEMVQCTVCEEWFEIDERGDVLDSSGRCDECRP